MTPKPSSQNQVGSLIKKDHYVGKSLKAVSAVSRVGISRTAGLHYLNIRISLELTSIDTFPDDKALFSTLEVGLQN